MNETDEHLNNVLATIISLESKKEGNDKMMIRVVNLKYDELFPKEPWRKSHYWKKGTMSKYFRTCDNFVFHRVGPGRHLVSVKDDFKYTPIDLKKKMWTPNSNFNNAKRTRVTRKSTIPTKSTKTSNFSKRVSSSPISRGKNNNCTVGDRTKFYEEKGEKLQKEENEVLSKQVESLEKQVGVREKTIQKQEKELVHLKLTLEKKNQELKQMQHEITLLKNEGKGYNDDLSSDESDMSEEEEMILEEMEFSDLFHKKNCELIYPKTISDIEKGGNTNFQIHCKGAVELAVIVDDRQWFSLKTDDGLKFEGNVCVQKYSSFVDVLAKFQPDGKFECIVTISIGE